MIFYYCLGWGKSCRFHLLPGMGKAISVFSCPGIDTMVHICIQSILTKFHFSDTLIVHKQHFFCLSSSCWLSFELLSGSFFVLPCDTNWDWLEGRIVDNCALQLCHQCSVSVPRWVKTQFPEKFGPGEMTSAITSWVTDSQPRVAVSITAASSALTRNMNRKQEIDTGKRCDPGMVCGGGPLPDLIIGGGWVAQKWKVASFSPALPTAHL